MYMSSLFLKYASEPCKFESIDSLEVVVLRLDLGVLAYQLVKLGHLFPWL